MLTILQCILQNCNRESRLSHTCSAKHPCHGAKPRQPTADGKQNFTIFPFCGWQLCFILFFKDVEKVAAILCCKEHSRCMHPLQSDLWQIGSADIPRCPIPLCHLSDHPSICQIPHNAIPQYFWVKAPLASCFSAPSLTLLQLLPLYSPPPPPQEGLLHTTTSTREVSFTPKASQEWHICQEIWCQYLRGALQSQLHKLSQAALPSILSPPPSTCSSVEKVLLQRPETSRVFSLHFFFSQKGGATAYIYTPSTESPKQKYAIWERKR